MNLVWTNSKFSTRRKNHLRHLLVFFFALVLGWSPQISLCEGQTEVDFFQMTLEEKVGQLFIFGFNGQAFDQNIEQMLFRHKPGGLIVFGRNVKSPWQVMQLNRNLIEWYLKRNYSLPLIMVDQEGGAVARIKTKPPAPSALSLGRTENPKVAEFAGRFTGEILRLLGFHMNLAPVADLASERKSSFIGNRAFGSNPQMVAQFVHSYLDGLHSSQILGTAKHFPGHGHIETDSHFEAAVQNIPMDVLRRRDLVPYLRMSQRREPSAIMVGHLSFPSIEPSRLPAPFSKRIINGLLRDQLGFNGLVITDDLEMAGAESVGDIGERAVRAIEAGCDMVMVAWSPHRQKKAVAAVIDAAKSGRLSENRINDSLRRILRAKMFSMGTQDWLPEKELKVRIEKAALGLNQLTKQVNFINFKQSADSLKHLQGKLKLQERVLILTSIPEFSKNFAQVHPLVQNLTLKPGMRVNAIKKVIFKEQFDHLVFYVSGTKTAKLLKSLPPDLLEKTIVVNGAHPSELEGLPFAAIFQISSNDDRSGEWVAHFLRGEPLRLPAAVD